MRSSLRLCVLLLILSAALSGCFLEKIKLPGYQENETAAWLSSLGGYSAYEQGQQADRVWRDRYASAELRQRALSIAASRPGSQGFAARQELSSRYMQADARMRSVLESMYWRDLDAMPLSELRSLSSRVQPAKKKTFPWNVLLLKAARKGVAADNQATLMLVSDPSLYANPAALGLTAAAAPSGSMQAALAVPQTGAGAAIGKRIAEGALAGADYLKGKGVTADIKIIDTSAASWQADIRNLPAGYKIIGGPLLPSQVDQLKAASAGRFFFSFTANLPPSVKEGADGWHFKENPEDQIRVLLDAAVSMGASRFGVYAPSDKFGRRMAEIFTREARARGYDVFAGYYTAGAAQSWTRESRKFVGELEQNGADALFLPDSWNNMELLVSSLQYAGLKKKLLMGPVLWEQNLGAGARTNAVLFSTTIFPASWNPYARDAGVMNFRNAMQNRNSRPDDWSALGFDFVQLAAELSGLQDMNASSLNNALAAMRISWAGAPFVWDGSGHSQRQLFIFRPESSGASPADLKSMGRELEPSFSSNPAPAQSVPSPAPSDIDQLANSILKNQR